MEDWDGGGPGDYELGDIEAAWRRLVLIIVKILALIAVAGVLILVVTVAGDLPPLVDAGIVVLSLALLATGIYLAVQGFLIRF